MSNKAGHNVWAIENAATETVVNSGRRALALIRCFFAFLVVVLILVGKPASRIDFWFSTGILVLYCVYSICYFVLKVWKHPLNDRTSYLIDVILFLYLILVFNFRESVFFALFLYPIIVAPRLGNARFAYIATFLAVVAFATIKTLDDSSTPYYGVINAALCLLSVGFAFSYLELSEEKSERNLKFLLDLNKSWSLRLGTEGTVLTNLKRIVHHFEADSAILILCSPRQQDEWKMYTATSNGELKSSSIVSAIADQLACIQPSVVAAYNNGFCSWSHRLAGYIEAHGKSNGKNQDYRRICEDLMNIFETCSLATVPYSQGNDSYGRIFLTSSRKAFGKSQLEFLLHVSRVISVVAENMSCTEQLISNATDYERLRISRDMHDTTIQPYIGLKLALEAMQRDVKGTAIEQKLSELIHMTSATVSDLRTYTTQLRDRVSMPGENLVAAIRKQADSFAKYYGIQVDIQEELHVPVNGQIAAEIYQILSEGLSNILRHTTAKRAYINITSAKSAIRLLVGNEVAPKSLEGNTDFTPRSITERVKALDGNININYDYHGYTVLDIQIPNTLAVNAW